MLFAFFAFFAMFAIARRVLAVLDEARAELEAIAYRRAPGTKPPGTTLMRVENDYHHVS
jgi:hypothetical protein